MTDTNARPDGGALLVAPHQFPDLDLEAELAQEFGLTLVAAPDVAAFRQALPDAAVVMVTPYARLEAADFAVMGSCRIVVRYGVGYDNIDVDAATARGIPVSIVPDASSDEVATHALAMGLALLRRLPTGNSVITSGGWTSAIGYDAPRLDETVVGVIGMGRIGRRVAELWSALGARVQAHDPYVTFDDVPSVSLDGTLTTSDVVTLHVPLVDRERPLVTADTLAGMAADAVIVNVSRGGLIDEVALAAALREGRLAGAALDTFAREPLPDGHPLRGAPNLILTPHIAWRSNRSVIALREGAVARARRVLAGKQPFDIVTAAVAGMGR